MNKLENLRLAAANFGLSPEDVVKGWYQNQYVRREFLQELLSNTEAEAEKIKPGMFYYAGDKSFSAEPVSEKQVSAIVGWVDESSKHGLVLGLREAELPWSSDCLVIDTFLGDGKKNTRLILEAARKQNKKAEAAEWCAAYDFDEIQPGEAFLPNGDELVKIFKNFDAVQKALKKINRPLLDKYNWYWSSSETYYRYAWVVRPSDGSMGYGSKYDYYGRVRCVLAF